MGSSRIVNINGAAQTIWAAGPAMLRVIRCQPRGLSGSKPTLTPHPPNRARTHRCPTSSAATTCPASCTTTVANYFDLKKSKGCQS